MVCLTGKGTQYFSLEITVLQALAWQRNAVLGRSANGWIKIRPQNRDRRWMALSVKVMNAVN